MTHRPRLLQRHTRAVTRPTGRHSLHFVSAWFDGVKQTLFLVQVLFGIDLFVSILLGMNYAKELEGCCLRKQKNGKS